MRTSIVIICVLCVGALLCIRIVRNYKTRTAEWPGLFFGAVFGFSVLALIINAASSTIYTITGTGTNDNRDAKYILFYSTKLQDDQFRLVFLAPYGNNYIQNETDYELTYHPINYGNVKNNYQVQQLLPHSLNRIEGKPSFFFQSIPSATTYHSRYNSKGTTRWVILKKGEEIQYKETIYELLKY